MWDSGSSLQFDWENLVMLDGKGAQVPRKLNSSVWGSDIDGIHLHSHACDFGSINGLSGLDAAYVSSVSSKSTSADSSSQGKTSIISVFDESSSVSIAVDFAKSKNPAASSVFVEASVGSVEPVIGLKLGKRTYFEDFCSASNAKTLAVSDKPLSSASSRRSRSSHQTMQSLRCQVEGCNVDLSGSKNYHRKHRICESHSKCAKVIVGGLECRFCQQCSRFHKLSEFDEKKRSCRKRLSDHNARRRKPRSEARHFNLDEKQQVGFVFNISPHHQARPTLSPWETCGSKFTLTRDYYPFSGKRTAGADHHQYLLGNRISNTISMQSYDHEGSPSKCSTPEFLDDGAGECIIPSNIVAAQDLRSAPSLLSTSDPVPIYHQPNNVFQQPETCAVLHCTPLASPRIWGSGPHPSDSPAPLVGFQSNLRPCSETFDLSLGENQLY